MNKPVWLDKKINIAACRQLKKTLRGLTLHTVCEEALCPNISECFSKKTATFLILGDICTRACSFCSVKKGRPREVSRDQPQRLAKAVKKLGLKYLVVTSPTRDDLPDGGAEFFFSCVRQIKRIELNIKIEVLVPDFSGRRRSIEMVSRSGADVIAHNIETVPQLYSKVRSRARYQRSLEVLKIAKETAGIYTKTGLMLGLGETQSQIDSVLDDLRNLNCDFITFGQYLPPSRKHYPVKEYIPLEKFSYLKDRAYKLGFKAVQSGPYTRSSYLAWEMVSRYKM